MEKSQGRAPEMFDPVTFVENHDWTFAKTMPHIPHEYVVRGKNGCAEGEWDAFAAHIARHGYKARWTSPSGRHMDNVYLELGDWKFWVIFPVINRERIANSTTERLDPGIAAADHSGLNPSRNEEATAEEAVAEAEMTIREAEEFIASVPWRHVKMVPVGHGLTEEEAIMRWGEYRHITPDPHEYVIKEWHEVDTEQFEAFAQLIKADGYRAKYVAPYRPDYVMTNHYLEIDGWCYWFIYPNMLNRERAEHRKHEPIRN